jgi:hypothetical protein
MVHGKEGHAVAAVNLQGEGSVAILSNDLEVVGCHVLSSR